MPQTRLARPSTRRRCSPAGRTNERLHTDCLCKRLVHEHKAGRPTRQGHCMQGTLTRDEKVPPFLMSVRRLIRRLRTGRHPGPPRERASNKVTDQTDEGLDGLEGPPPGAHSGSGRRASTQGQMPLSQPHFRVPLLLDPAGNLAWRLAGQVLLCVV